MGRGKKSKQNELGKKAQDSLVFSKLRYCVIDEHLAREMEENHEEYLEAQQAMAEDMGRQLEEEARRQRMIEEAVAQHMEEQQQQ